MIVQLQTLTGILQGLTRTTDSLLVLEESSADQAEAEQLQQTRDDYCMVKLREDIFGAFRSTIGIWSGDASMSDVRTALLLFVPCCDARIVPCRPHSFLYVPIIVYYTIHYLLVRFWGWFASPITRHPTWPSNHISTDWQLHQMSSREQKTPYLWR